MTEVLAVFRSRSQAADCNLRLKSAGVPANLINTPKEANVGCGLSIKFERNYFERVRYIIRNSHYTAFYGYFTIQTIYGRTTFMRIN